VFLGTGVFPLDFKQQRNNNREEINNNKRTKYDRTKLNEKRKRDEWKGGKDTRVIFGLVAADSFVLLTGSTDVTTLIRTYRIYVENLLQIIVSKRLKRVILALSF